jgi:hypothetical protein
MAGLFARFGVLGLGVIFAYVACLAWTTGATIAMAGGIRRATQW